MDPDMISTISNIVDKKPSYEALARQALVYMMRRTDWSELIKDSKMRDLALFFFGTTDKIFTKAVDANQGIYVDQFLKWDGDRFWLGHQFNPED